MTFTVFAVHDFKHLIHVRSPNNSRSSGGKTTGTILHVIQRSGEAGRVFERADKVVVFCGINS